MTEKSNLLNLDEFINKVHSIKKQNKLDLSSDQDLSIALMNLISLEEHFYFSGVKTNDNKFYDLLLEVREIRKSLLKKLVKEGAEGNEIWCISKHLLAASMRLMEVGTKQLDQGNKNYTYEMFQKAYELYSLFWGLNLGIIEKKDINKGNLGKDKEMLLATLEKNPPQNLNLDATNTLNESNNPSKKTWRGKLGNLVRKLIDCCLE